MPTARRIASIAAPPEAIWRILADVESWPRWLRVPYAGESVTASPPGEPGAGTEIVLKGRLRHRLFARLTAWEPGRCLAFEIHRSEYPLDRWFFHHAVIRIEIADRPAGGATVTCTHRLQGKGPAGRLYAALVMRPFLAFNVQRIIDSLATATRSR
jgi:uncharacterized protein YndB with AHSA1/START domain